MFHVHLFLLTIMKHFETLLLWVYVIASFPSVTHPPRCCSLSSSSLSVILSYFYLSPLLLLRPLIISDTHVHSSIPSPLSAFSSLLTLLYPFILSFPIVPRLSSLPPLSPHSSSHTDAPKVRLQLGSSLKPDHIRQGDDVYFDCLIVSNPAFTRISWYKEVSCCRPRAL